MACACLVSAAIIVCKGGYVFMISRYTRFLGVLLFVVIVNFAEARDAARDLSRMIGYTIAASASVRSCADSSSAMSKIIVLDNGMVFKVDMLLLEPLVYTDVIIFVKSVSGVLMVKLLIDNEAYDAILLSS